MQNNSKVEWAKWRQYFVSAYYTQLCSLSYKNILVTEPFKTNEFYQSNTIYN